MNARIPIGHWLLIAVLFLSYSIRANNIQVTNLSYVSNGEGGMFVQFDLSWENSWRFNGAPNWDAAWVFVKYRTVNEQGFRHARLALSGHTAPGAVIDFLPRNPELEAQFDEYPIEVFEELVPVMGAYVRRASEGSGPFNATGVRLHWKYSKQGLGLNDIAELRVYAIEMAYVNEGAFHVGSGGTETNAFRAGGSTAPFEIRHENGINLGNTAGMLYASAYSPTSGSLPQAFPVGYAASYMMKYELSQQQYVDFLNSLSRAQQAACVFTNVAPGISTVAARYVMNPGGGSIMLLKQGIRCNQTIDPNAPITFYCDANGNGTGGEANDGQWVPCSVSVDQALRFLDWSCLRPMSELEFEKACRGPRIPVPNEFPWGSTAIAAAPYTMVSAFTTGEGITTNYATNAGNAVYDVTLPHGAGTVDAWAQTHPDFGPVRSGACAAPATNTGRVTAGAGYYGAMDLGGDLEEIVVGIGSGSPSLFDAETGDGELGAAGEALWATGSLQFLTRGGGLGTGPTTLRVSQRSGLSTGGSIRGVRKLTLN